jgi:cytochrome P450
MHEHIPMLFTALQGFRLYYIFYYWPIMRKLRSIIADERVVQGRVNWYKWVAQQTQTRASRETQRPDFMTEILKHNGEKGISMSMEELESNASIMLTAGSETTATLLSGVTFLLLKNPTVLQKLIDEVRGKWKTYEEITLDQVNNTPYLIAVLQEALRWYPPVPTGFERRVGKGGAVVSGYFVPEGTAVGVSSWPTGHSERNFKDAELFVPERWLGDPRYADDKKSSIQPFSFGPRNCLGKVSQLPSTDSMVLHRHHGCSGIVSGSHGRIRFLLTRTS